MKSKAFFILALGTLLISYETVTLWAYAIYNRPNPLMDYVAQEMGIYDAVYGYYDDGRYVTVLTADHCWGCHSDHGSGVGCLRSGCHSWGDVAAGGLWHHNSVQSGSGNCAFCHDSGAVENLAPFVSLEDDPPVVKLPTPLSCENCHWEEAVATKTGTNLGTVEHPCTNDHYDGGQPFGYYEYGTKIYKNYETHHMEAQNPNVTDQCYFCHGWGNEWIDPSPPEGQLFLEFDDPRIIRPCERCHTNATLHAIHSQDYNGWEAVGFHVPENPQTDPDFYRLFTAAEMCDGCHAPRQDVIGTIREKLSGRQGLYMCDAPNALDGDTNPSAMEKGFGNSNQGDNIIAMAYVDTDGDTIHEVAVIRQRSTGRQRLEIYDHDGSSLLASDLSFGDLNSDKNNIAMSALDLDGDGTDEIAVVRQKQTGKQQLFIFNAPPGIDAQAEPPIATDNSFGFSGTGRNIIAMTGLDTDGDHIDEIAVIMERTNGRQRLEIYNAPSGVGGETGAPIASALIFGNRTTNKNNIAITSLDVNLDQIDEIAVVREKLNGRQRLEIYNAPQGIGGDTGPPVATDLTFGQAGTDIYTKFISGVRF
jgi:hypothetical protein